MIGYERRTTSSKSTERVGLKAIIRQKTSQLLAKANGNEEDQTIAGFRDLSLITFLIFKDPICLNNLLPQAVLNALKIHGPEATASERLTQTPVQTNTKVRDTRDRRDTLNFPLLA